MRNPSQQLLNISLTETAELILLASCLIVALPRYLGRVRAGNDNELGIPKDRRPFDLCDVRILSKQHEQHVKWTVLGTKLLEDGNLLTSIAFHVLAVASVTIDTMRFH